MSFKSTKLKYHKYFLTSVILRRSHYLTEEKIESILLHYSERLTQENGRISYWGYLMDDKKYLRVITEEKNGEQVVFNSFYDRDFIKKTGV